MGETLGAVGKNQSSTKDIEAELHGKKSAEVFQAAQISQGTLRTPCWLIFFSFCKTCNIYDTPAPVPCRQLPSPPCREFLCRSRAGGTSSLTQVFLLPGSPGHGTRKRGLSCLQGALRFPNISFPKLSCKEESWGRLGNFASA